MAETVTSVFGGHMLAFFRANLGGT
jgi:hypothetical protein